MNSELWCPGRDVCVAEELFHVVGTKCERWCVARSIASGRLAGHPDRHLAAVVRRRGVVHGHLVGALDGVVGRDEGEFRRCGVLDRDGLRGRRAVSVSSVAERANDGVVARSTPAVVSPDT